MRRGILETIRVALLAGDVDAALALVVNELASDGLVDFDFTARHRDGSSRRVTFYARSEAEALENARAWARRAKYEIQLPEPEGERAA